MTTLMRDRLIVTAAAVVWIAGTLVGMGVVGAGTGAARQGEGLFSDHATLIAPHGPAFTIWPVVYLGLAVYVIWQWLPTGGRSRLADRTRLPAAASLALNGLWLLVVWAGWLAVSVLVMGLLVVALGIVLQRVSDEHDVSPVAGGVVGLTFGVYLGWICVATCANIASWLVGLGVPATGPVSTWTTVAVLVVVVALAAFLLRRSRHRWFRAGLAAAIVWGTAWVSVGRFSGDLRSTTVGIAAAVAAAAVGVAWLATRAAPQGPARRGLAGAGSAAS